MKNLILKFKISLREEPRLSQIIQIQFLEFTILIENAGTADHVGHSGSVAVQSLV